VPSSVPRRISTFLGLLIIALVAVAPASGLEIQSIVRAAEQYQNPNLHLQMMFRAALLDTTKLAEFAPDGTAYVKTGDIPAEWLRDASAQVRPYLYYAKSDPAVRALLRAIIARQAKYVQIDPYANAFTLDYRVWEEKYELDSLAYPITLAWSYWHETGDSSIFTSDEQKALYAALSTMQREQNHARDSRYSHKELVNAGGRPVGYTGMIWTGFRPSDDACYYNYLIPSEMFAVVALGDMEQIERQVYHDGAKARAAALLGSQVRSGIEKYGMVDDKKYGRIYVFEADGLGNAIMTDDANIPSLLSAPYIGYAKADDPYYLNTRAFLLSGDNASYYSGNVARGIGSYHTPDHWVWPLALVMEGLTSDSPTEKQDVLNQLLASDPGDHLLHESFDPNDPKRYTRVDFGWPNALFSEYVLTSFDGVSPIPMGEKST
jgi:meiotically up-regulated gene 157 (Mug157) protein